RRPGRPGAHVHLVQPPGAVRVAAAAEHRPAVRAAAAGPRLVATGQVLQPAQPLDLVPGGPGLAHLVQDRLGPGDHRIAAALGGDLRHLADPRPRLTATG